MWLAALRKQWSDISNIKFGLSLALVLVHFPVANGQEASRGAAEFWEHPPVIGVDLINSYVNSANSLDVGPISRTPRIQMFRMLPGFLSDPPGLNGADDPVDPDGPSGRTDANTDGFTVNFGDDNPYFDPRRSGDPGGVGYLRIHSQLQLVDMGNTSVCFGLRAWTPAGLENGGVQQGQTVVAPGVGIFHDLGAGTALHGFVDQSVFNASHQGPIRCGMAFNCPLNPWDELANNGFFVSVQAMGRLDYGPDRQGRPMNWDVVPGLHWRLSDAFWMSLGASRSNILTCSWHF